MIVRQVPHEEAHNATHDQTREQLEKPQEMERHARVMRRRGLCAAVEWLEHDGRGKQGCVVFATDVEDCVVWWRRAHSEYSSSVRYIPATIYAAGMEIFNECEGAQRRESEVGRRWNGMGWMSRFSVDRRPKMPWARVQLS